MLRVNARTRGPLSSAIHVPFSSVIRGRKLVRFPACDLNLRQLVLAPFLFCKLFASEQGAVRDPKPKLSSFSPVDIRFLLSTGEKRLDAASTPGHVPPVPAPVSIPLRVDTLFIQR